MPIEITQHVGGLVGFDMVILAKTCRQMRDHLQYLTQHSIKTRLTYGDGTVCVIGCRGGHQGSLWMLIGDPTVRVPSSSGIQLVQIQVSASSQWTTVASCGPDDTLDYLIASVVTPFDYTRGVSMCLEKQNRHTIWKNGKWKSLFPECSSYIWSPISVVKITWLPSTDRSDRVTFWLSEELIRALKSQPPITIASIGPKNRPL